MREQIYTIPINEAFDQAITNEPCDCPFCLLHDMLEKNELELIMGASMMEPDVRIETNKKGFCKHHFDRLYENGNRLGLALVLESHLAEIEKKIFEGGTLFDGKGEKEQAKLEKPDSTCYVCDRIEEKFRRVMVNTADLHEETSEFRRKFNEQTMFCLPHYKQLLRTAVKCLDKKAYAELAEDAVKIENAYLDKLKNDVSWFCKKFDYNYENEPWYDSKDAVERAFKFLRSDLHNK
mgnify:CR=1 FL=1